MTIKNTILNAERHYDSFINQPDDWNFFLGLAEYVKFVSEEKTSEKIIIEAMDQGKARFKDLSELSKKSIVETTGVFEKLVEIIREDKIDFPGLKMEIQEYEDCKNGLMFSSTPLPFTLFETLAEIIEILVKNNYVDKIKDYVLLRAEPGEGGQYCIKEFTFSHSFSEYEKADKLFNDKRDIEIWGVWDNLVMVYNSVFKKEEMIAELDKDKKNFWQALNARGVISELDKIKEGKSDNSPVYFKKQNFITKASRFHNYLIKALTAVEDEMGPAEEKKLINGELFFYPVDGKAEYKGVVGEFGFGKKHYELLVLLNNSKFTPFNLDDIKRHCNEKITNDRHKFKAEKDVFDTINYIKRKLKVKTGEYFPVRKKGKAFIWEKK